MPDPHQYRKKLIEVALPLEAINKESAYEKMPGIGPHPRGLHHWWARRPLVACRAIIFASIVDDPSEWPEIFPTEKEQENERKRLFSILTELANWKNSNNRSVILKAQTEIARSIARNRGETLHNSQPDVIYNYIHKFCPPLLDPFCGRGSIPLEAQRLGINAIASDLNPVAVLITKALIEIPPKFSGNAPINPISRSQKTIGGKWEGTKGFAADLRYYGNWMREEALRQIGHLYPKVKITQKMAEERKDLEQYIGQELTVISWLWTRTIASPDPAVHGAEVPLVRSFWLSTKKKRKAWIKPEINRSSNSYEFKIGVGESPSDFDPRIGTVLQKKIGIYPKGPRCLLSGTKIDFEYIRNEGKSGRIGTRLMAIVAEGKKERIYLPPLKEHSLTALSAQPKDFPETDLPEHALGFRVQLYGMNKHHKLFTARQLLALTFLSDLIKEVQERVFNDCITSGILPDDNRSLNTGGIGAKAYSEAISVYLALVIDRCTDFNNNLTRWVPSNEKVMNLFARQAIPMVWDYAEANILEKVVGGFPVCCSYIADCMETLPEITDAGQAQQFDATAYIWPLSSAIISTDPPYYDNIGYSDLSDFFYIWLRRSLISVYPSLFATILTPKKQELIASPYRHEGNDSAAMKFFEDGLISSFSKMGALQHPEYPLTLYYAYGQEEIDIVTDESYSLFVASTGWETMLNGLIQTNYTITGTWPIRSEQSSRIVAADTNSLNSSIVFVCRPRQINAPLATRREYIARLKNELPDALRILQQSSIAPVDLAQAAIGPGMAVFTSYVKVMESDGSPMSVRTALALINQTLDEILTEQEGEFDSDTRWAVAWFDQYGMSEGQYGTAETLSKAKNTSVSGLADDGIISSKGGKVQLVRREHLPKDWDPTTDKRLTVWEATQHLIRALEEEGESGAAILLRKLGGGMGESARDLAYRLYSICERKKWSQEALGFNSLIVAWPEVSRLAHSTARTERAQRMITGEE